MITLFAVTACAREDGITLSEDYRTLEYNGETYTCFNYSESDVWVRNLQYRSIDVEIIGNDSDVVDVDVYISGSVINLDLYFEDNYVAFFYITDSAYSALLDFEKNGSDNLYTTGAFGNEIELTSEALKGETSVMKSTEYVKHYAETVIAINENGSLEKTVGEYIVADGEVYYLDYSELSGEFDVFFALEYSEIPLWRVTDESVVDMLINETDTKKVDNSKVLVAITSVILVLVFAVLPVIAMIVGGILLSKAKGEYKGLMKTVVVFAAVTLVAFVVMAICFIVLT